MKENITQLFFPQPALDRKKTGEMEQTPG
jgi:hypothetical protein